MGLETIAVIGTVASAAIGAVGAIQQGQAQSRAAAYQAQVAANNAAISERNQQIADRNAKLMEDEAQAAEAAGAQRSNLESLRTRELIGKQKAAAAAAGLDVNSGSALDIRAGAAGLGMLSDLNIRDETARKALGYRIRGLDYEDQAVSAGTAADNFRTSALAGSAAAEAASTAGFLNAAGSLAGGAARTGSMIADFQRQGGTVIPTGARPTIE